MELSKGYIFGTKLKATAIEGVARTTHDMMRLNTIFGGEHQINNKYDGFIIRDAKRKIARAIGVDENISNNALRILFGPEDMQMLVIELENILHCDFLLMYSQLDQAASAALFSARCLRALSIILLTFSLISSISEN